jgi:hypothetical protein
MDSKYTYYRQAGQNVTREASLLAEHVELTLGRIQSQVEALPASSCGLATRRPVSMPGGTSPSQSRASCSPLGCSPMLSPHRS